MDNFTINVSKVIDGNIDTVWNALTKEEELKQWYAPAEMTMPSAETDLRVGGNFTWTVRDAEGNDYTAKGEFKEVVADGDERKIVQTWTWVMGSHDQEHTTLLTTTLERLSDNQTKVTMLHENIPSQEEFDSQNAGAQEVLDGLQRYIAG
jgi:uncharacterized protein YndB with AHSA1/START domain